MDAEPAHWETVGEQLHAACVVYDVYRRHVRHPGDGREADFFIQKAPDWVQVLPMTPAGELVLVRQYRHAAEALGWELPGGVMDEGEDPVGTAARELAEETGYVGERPRLVGKVMPNPALIDNWSHFVLIENCHPRGGQDLDAHEEIAVRTAPPAEVVAMVRRGEIVHALMVTALAFIMDLTGARRD